jgi:hypothetical protein
MKRSDQPTEYVFIKAYTNSEWDNCDFAIIHLSPQWCAEMSKRLTLLQPFIDDDSFFSHCYWDRPVGFYTNIMDDDITDHILNEGEEWVFVSFADNKPIAFPEPENALSTHELVLTKHGSAWFTALGKHTGEEFYTASFDAAEFTNMGVPVEENTVS